MNENSPSLDQTAHSHCQCLLPHASPDRMTHPAQADVGGPPYTGSTTLPPACHAPSTTYPDGNLLLRLRQEGRCRVLLCPGTDKVAEAAPPAVEYGSPVAQLLPPSCCTDTDTDTDTATATR
ncbi:hypothetical protein GCM10027073_47650 [Streptomyces chlorus]